MAQDKGLVYRGLLLLGMMLVLVTMVALILFRQAETPVEQKPQEAGLFALTVPTPALAFPSAVNWIGLGKVIDKLPDAPGWNVRYNATLALARAGSEQLPLGVLGQMLDEDLQIRNFLVLTEDNKLVADENAARRTVSNALKALADWHTHKDAVAKVGTSNPALQRVYAAVDRLTHSHSPALQDEAKSIKTKIDSGKW